LVFAVFFVVSLLATLIIVPLIVIKIPADYFKREGEHPQLFGNCPPPVRMALLVVKNILGVALVIVGVAMLVLPGQGVIVILIGVLLLDFPGKQRIERWLIGKGPILKLANWVRKKAHRAPLTLE